tara:strand:+ start:160 stop:882 length:723 start_codon:yes stop_codon:yes gene_type:complete
MVNYDLVIMCHPKDEIKLQYSLESCRKFLEPQPENIYVVSPIKLCDSPVINILDEDAIRIKKGDIKFKRNNWIYQQFVKLFQDFTKNDKYLCVDSDLIFNQSVSIGDCSTLFISDRNQCHLPYFRFMDKFCNLEKQVGFTFINDFMMFDKNICREITGGIYRFLDFCNQNLTDDCLLSEFELYGNYICSHYPELVKFKRTKTQLNGKPASIPWSKEEIEHLIEENSENKSLDLFTIHSWT